MTLQGKRILVTGGTGFVGAHLIQALLSKDAYIVSTMASHDPKSFFSTNKFSDKVNVETCDMEEYDHVYNVITKHEIEIIFHLAAQPLVDVAFHNPVRTLATNIMGTTHILESARQYKNVKAVIVASSDKAYGKGKKQKYTEGDALAGDHPYEVSKSAADLICTTYARTYGIPVTVSRFGNIYGEGDLNFSRIVPGIARAVISGEKLVLRSDGTLIRDYLYVNDVVEGYLRLAENIQKTQGQAYNFGSSDTYSVLELIKIVEKVMGMKVPYKILNNAHNEIPYQSLDYSKAHRDISWEPQYQMREVIRSVINWYRGTIGN